MYRTPKQCKINLFFKLELTNSQNVEWFGVVHPFYFHQLWNVYMQCNISSLLLGKFQLQLPLLAHGSDAFMRAIALRLHQTMVILGDDIVKQELDVSNDNR